MILYQEKEYEWSQTFCVLLNEVREAKSNFDKRAKLMQEWANIPLNVDGKTFMASIIKSENLAKKMYELACQEISKRGKNVFALYSAFTNYASYADERNGFNIRNTGFDTKAETMWRREQEVAKGFFTSVQAITGSIMKVDSLLKEYYLSFEYNNLREETKAQYKYFLGIVC